MQLKAQTLPEPRLAPLPADHNPELADHFKVALRNLGFIPNSQLTMQRRPKIMKAFAALTAAVWDPSDSTVDLGFKRLVALVASESAGCRYCMAHTAGSALRFGVDGEKLKAVWDYRASPLFTAGERAALDLAMAAAAVPNDVTDAMFAEVRKHWTDEQVVELVAVISMFGFLNRWNDTMATPLEAEPVEIGEKFLADHGWAIGKHARSGA